MEKREELDKLDINQLYEWVNEQYDKFTAGNISEADYQADLDYYKAKLAKSNSDPDPVSITTDVESNPESQQSKISTSKVRSTSIAGLRKKLLDELNE